MKREAAIFWRALRCAAHRRPAFVAAVCGGDAHLHARIRALLRAHESGTRFLDPLVTPAGPPPDISGTSLGRYCLLEKLGEGAGGEVYAAEQHRPIRRDVAIKLLKPALGAEGVARFEAEARTLAALDHPHIARLLDSDTTAGRPFFVMELVRGEPITRFCARAQLPPCARLRLFHDVCVAIAHAHGRGVIHRDLKPSNILVAQVEGQPVAKIIDFGIAASRARSGTPRARAGIYGTPAYMSPEQAAGTMPDPRADVFALGVLLHEILTGRRPGPHRHAGAARTIAVQRSPRCHAETVSRDLGRPLAAIVHRCTAVPPEERYATAQLLADDIVRCAATLD